MGCPAMKFEVYKFLYARCKTSADMGLETQPKRSCPEKTDPMKRVAKPRESDLKLTYEQHEVLGEGGFAFVFAGVRIKDQQPVAIKRIKRENVEFVPVTIEKEVFTVPSEVVLMTRAAPDHDSVGLNPSVSLLDWYLQDQGQEVVLVMERPTPSENLLQHIIKKNAPLPEVNAKELIRQVVNALVDLHSKDVFHRDLKLDNLLVQATESGPRIRIIDFGCGCDPQSEPYYKYNGTPEFAPPEAHMSKGYCAGPTSVWQTGALLYELMRSNCDKDFSTKAFMQGFPFITFLSLNGVSQECSDFLRACLTRDPNQRISLTQLSLHPWLCSV